MTPERLQEIKHFATRFGCGNGWTGTVGTACTYLRELMDETLLPPGMEVITTESRQDVGKSVGTALARKQRPIVRGVLDYFPLAIAEVAHVSYVGNEQHNPGEPMRWAREKSTDHADCIVRHLIDRGKMDTDGLRHTAKVAWRALALLQEELEKAGQHETSTEHELPNVVADVPVAANKGSEFKAFLSEHRQLVEASA
jgi:hypothetical protein